MTYNSDMVLDQIVAYRFVQLLCIQIRYEECQIENNEYFEKHTKHALLLYNQHDGFNKLQWLNTEEKGKQGRQLCITSKIN